MSAIDTVKDFARIASTAGISKDVIDLLDKKVVLLADQIATFEQENTTLLRENRDLKLENEKLKSQLEKARPKGDEFDPICNQMLVVLANSRGGDGITDDDLINHFRLPKAKGDYLFAQLRQRKFVDSAGGQMGRGAFWYVTDEGLAYLAKSGLLEAKPSNPLLPQGRSSSYGGPNMF